MNSGRARLRVSTSLPQPAKLSTPTPTRAAEARSRLKSGRPAKVETISLTAPRAGISRAHSIG